MSVGVVCHQQKRGRQQNDGRKYHSVASCTERTESAPEESPEVHHTQQTKNWNAYDTVRIISSSTEGDDDGDDDDDDNGDDDCPSVLHAQHVRDGDRGRGAGY